MAASGDVRLFVALDDEGQLRVGGPWALMEVKGEASINDGTVTAAAAVMIEANPVRRALLIRNLSGQTIYLGVDSSVTPATGFPIDANGTFEDDISNGAWWAVTSTGSAQWRSIEV